MATEENVKEEQKPVSAKRKTAAAPDSGGAVVQSHADLLQKARRDRAQQEANQRLNRIHEMEMQIKVQAIRQPDVPLIDANTGMTWEEFHDLFWQAKRGLIYKDDPLGLNAHLAKILKEEKQVAWQNEGAPS
jgi:hypothetical protein